MKQHVMVDLETLGRRAGCAILSIGAVRFDETEVELANPFYLVMRRADCAKAGLHEDPSTLAWWEDKSPSARQVIEDAGKETATPLASALLQFGEFVGKGKVWGCGSDFDNAILYAAYAAIGLEVPWKFWDSRCYRTLKTLYPEIKMARQGTYHNALDDAISQAQHAVEIFKAKGLK